MPRRGAYGLVLDGVGEAGSELLVDAPDGWVDWTFVRRTGSADGDGTISAERALLGVAPAGALLVERAAARSTLTMTSPPDDAGLVHPYLAPTAAIVARWLGRDSFHAGAVLGRGGAWGVLGGRGAGKSTLLAMLSDRGAHVLADDLLVLAGHTALAGPRCVDLRGDASAALGLGEALGVVGTRERWRVDLEPVAAESPFCGWIALGWSDELDVREVAPAERLPRLLDNLALSIEPYALPALLDRAAAPMVELRRPRGFETASDAAEAVLAFIAS